MQIILPKWVTKLAILVLSVLGVIEALSKVVDVTTLPAPWNYYTAIAFGILAALGRALGDDDGDGVMNFLDPDYRDRRGAASMAVILALASLGLLLAACGPAIAGAKPGIALSVGGDEVIVRATCDTDAPNVACLISVTDSISGQVVANETRVDRGQTLTLPSRACTAAGPVVYVGTFVGVTASGRRAPPAVGTGRATCDPAGPPARPSIVVEIRPGGS